MTQQAWPPNLDESQIDRIVSSAVGYFESKSTRAHVDNGMLEFPDEPERGRIGLWNVAAQCAQIDERDWDRAVHDFLDQLDASHAEQEQVEHMLSDFDSVRSRLTVQIWPEEIAAKLPPSVNRVDLPGTRTMLMVDSPSSIRSVPRHAADAWEREDDELLDLGLENLERMFSPELSQIEMGLPEPVRCLGAEPPMDAYVGTCVLRLDRFTGLIGVHGTLLVVPSRDMVVGYPIDGVEVLKAVQQLAVIACKASAERPYPLSPDLHWRHPNGSFVTIPCPVVEGQLQLQIPREFQELLEHLAEA